MSFHLSLPVRNLAESRAFFVDVLQAVITDDAGSYINLELAGAQLTLHQREDMPAPSKDMHFGVNIPVDAFQALAAHIQQVAAGSIMVPPRIVDAGTDRERHKMFLRSPSGYSIEIKGVTA